jgi:hypothetical protein
MTDLMEVCPWCDGIGLERDLEPWNFHDQFRERNWTLTDKPCWHCKGRGYTNAAPVDAVECECEHCGGQTLWEGGPSGFDYPISVDYRDGSVNYGFEECRWCEGKGSVWLDTEPITPDDFEEAYGVAA